MAGSAAVGSNSIKWERATPNVQIALRLGRTIFSNLVHNIPDAMYPQRCLQYTLECADIGHKFHGREHVPAMCAAGAAVCVNSKRERFELAIPNLGMPSLFRLVWDGVTLPNRATFLPVLTDATSAGGNIENIFADAPAQGASHVAEQTSKIVFDVAERCFHMALPIKLAESSPMPPAVRSRLEKRGVKRWSLFLSASIDGKERSTAVAVNSARGTKATVQWDWLHKGNACGKRALNRQVAQPLVAESSTSSSSSSSSSSSVASHQAKSKLFKHHSVKKWFDTCINV